MKSDKASHNLLQTTCQASLIDMKPVEKRSFTNLAKVKNRAEANVTKRLIRSQFRSLMHGFKKVKFNQPAIVKSISRAAKKADIV